MDPKLLPGQLEGLPLRMPHPDSMNRIANYCMFCEKEFLSLHVTYVLFPEAITTDEDRVFILQKDPLKRFQVKKDEEDGSYYVRLVEISDQDRAVISGVNEWKDTMAKYLRSLPGQSIPLTNLISECQRPASVSRELRIKDALRVDLQERFELNGHSDMLYVNYKLSKEGVETTKENWRNNMEKFLVLSNMKKVPLTTLRNSVSKPLLLKKSIKMIDVIDEDPKQRFCVTDADNLSNVAYIGLVIDELERAKEKWRIRLAMQLASPPYQCAMTTLGGAVPRPVALARSVTLMEVVNTDPKKRFEIGGKSPQMFVKLTNIPGSKDKANSSGNKGMPSGPPPAAVSTEAADGWTVVSGSKKLMKGGEGNAAVGSRDGTNASFGSEATPKQHPQNAWTMGKGLASVTRAPASVSYAASLQKPVSKPVVQLSSDLKATPAVMSSSAEKVDGISASLVSGLLPPPGFGESAIPLLESLPQGLSGALFGKSSEGIDSSLTWGRAVDWSLPEVSSTLHDGLIADVLSLGSLLSDIGIGQSVDGALDVLNDDLFGPIPSAVFDDDDNDEEVMPSFLMKDKSSASVSATRAPAPAQVSPLPVGRTGSAQLVLLDCWLPEVLEGFPPPLISSFCAKLSEEGFISAQDLLDAQVLGQLTADYLRDTCGFKLGHYNRLMKGLSSL